MAKGNLIASAGSKEQLEAMINKYFYSENYIITDDMKIFNKLKNKYSDSHKVVVKKNRWRFEHCNLQNA